MTTVHTGGVITTQSGSILLVQQDIQKIDKEVFNDLIIGQTVVMILIVIIRFLYLITHPKKIKVIK